MLDRSADSERSALFESLERRQLMSASAGSSGVTGNESIDGTGNNLAHANWGSVDEQLLRKAPAAYGDGVSSPAGASRPGARAISNSVAASAGDLLNDRDLSAFVYAWGQFLDHDIDLTTNGQSAEAFNVTVPLGDTSFDPYSTGDQVIGLNRSDYDPTTGTSKRNPRQQINTITAWIDGSVVYGSDPDRADALRTKSGGKLKSSPGDLLPYNTNSLANANDAHLYDDDDLFLAGDVRANENIELTSLQTLFMREHNRLAAQIAASQPGLNDEAIYQRARRIVIAEIQSITYNEFLPALLGNNALSTYTGYKSNVNPSIANEFSTAAFRLGHSMLGDDVEFLDNNGAEIHDELPLANAFFNPKMIEETGIDPILKYLASDRTQELDNQVVDGVRNFLFGPPGAGGLDLASLNIQRGRDHGLADYNTVRASYGLPKVTSFSQITSNAALAATLKNLYGTVDNIDLWVGGLAEDHLAGSSVGATFTRILKDQFQRLRDADRFWFERQFSGAQLRALENTRLSDIIRRNSELTNLQSNVFVFNAAVNGTLYNDLNANGRQDRTEKGIGGWIVELLDDTDTVIATTLSGLTGKYSFAHLDLGDYHVRTILAANWVQTTADAADVHIVQGSILAGGNFGFARVFTPAKPIWPTNSSNNPWDHAGTAGNLMADVLGAQA